MKKQTRTEPIFPNPLPRRQVVTVLVHKFAKDCEAIIRDFPQEKRVEMLEHILGCVEIIEEYLKKPGEDIWQKYAEKEREFLKKHKSRLKFYRNKNMRDYFSEFAFAEKDLYTSKEYNSLPFEEQTLSPQEMENFIRSCKNYLNNERDYILLAQEPDEEEENLGKTIKDDKDPKASLSAQLLIIHYLLRELKVERGDVDISHIARFSHFLLGKKITILSNSDIYKKLCKIPNHKTDKELIKELQTIHPFFDNLGLKNITFEIEKEIGLARKEKKKKF